MKDKKEEGFKFNPSTQPKSSRNLTVNMLDFEANSVQQFANRNPSNDIQCKADSVNQFYSLLFGQIMNSSDIILPSTVHAKFLTLEIAKEFNIPQGLDIEWLIKLVVSLNIKSYDDLLRPIPSDKSKESQALRDALLASVKDKKSLDSYDHILSLIVGQVEEMAKDSGQQIPNLQISELTYEDISVAVTRVLSSVIQNNWTAVLRNTLDKKEGVDFKLKWFSQSQVGFDIFKSVRETYKSMASLLQAGGDVTAALVQVKDELGKQDVDGVVFGFLDMMNNHSGARSAFPSHFVYTDALKEWQDVNPIMSATSAALKDLAGDKFPSIRKKSRTSSSPLLLISANMSAAHTVRSLHVTDALGVSDLSLKHFLDHYFALRSAVFNASYEEGDGSDMMKDVVMKHLQEFMTMPFAELHMSGSIKDNPLEDLIQVVHWLILSDRILRGDLEKSPFPWYVFDRKVDQLSIDFVVRYMDVLHTISTSYVQAVKTCYSLFSSFINHIGWDMSDDPLMTGTMDLGLSMPLIEEWASVLWEPDEDLLDRKRQRFNKAMNKRNRSLWATASSVDNLRYNTRPTESPDLISSIGCMSSSDSLFSTPYEVITEWTTNFFGKKALQEANPIWSDILLSKKHHLFCFEGHLQTRNWVSRLREIDVYSDYADSVALRIPDKVAVFGEPLHSFLRDLDTLSIFQTDLFNRMKIYSKRIWDSDFEKLPSLLRYTYKNMMSLNRVEDYNDVLYLLGLPLGKGALREFAQAFPIPYSYYFSDDEGTIKGNYLIDTPDDMFDNIIVTLDPSVTLFNDIRISTPESVLTGLAPSRIYRPFKMFHIDMTYLISDARSQIDLKNVFGAKQKVKTEPDASTQDSEDQDKEEEQD